MLVAAYCRVSTDKEDQANSFESQQRYFRDYIDRQPGWTLFSIYADSGTTGTSTQKRAAFNRMMQDAKLHKFDLIVTKEVSRFSRNILDSIAYTRELKRLGIGVQFMNDGINTLDPDAELRLSILSSIAQEESRKTSSRVKWGQTRRMEQGVVFGRSLLGYDVKDGKMTVNPEGAKVVRMIFDKYVHERKGTVTIARELREAGIKTLTGGIHWRNTVILKILRNEKYCGDLKQKKTYTPDYLTHQKKYNHGQEDFICLRDHHTPIVSRGLWEAAQEEIRRRDLDGAASAGHGNRYPLSGKIKCSECGQSFVSRTRRRRSGEKYKTWRCATATAEGKRHTDAAGNRVGCDMGYQIRDDTGMEMLKTAVSMLELDRKAVLSRVASIVTNVLQASRETGEAHAGALKKERDAVRERKKSVLDAFFRQSISEEDMTLMNGEYDRQLTLLSERIREAERREGPSADAMEGDIRRKLADLVNGKIESGNFYGNLLEGITAYPDRRVELRLKHLPAVWTYTLENLGS